MVPDCFQRMYSHVQLKLTYQSSIAFHWILIDIFDAKTTVTDKAYAGIFTSALAISVLILCTSYYRSKDPIFANKVLKLPRFRHRNYDSLAQDPENGNGVDPKEGRKNPEPLNGWRFRLCILLDLFFFALVVVHTVILVSSGSTLLRIVIIPYWVDSS